LQAMPWNPLADSPEGRSDAFELRRTVVRRWNLDYFPEDIDGLIMDIQHAELFGLCVMDIQRAVVRAAAAMGRLSNAQPQQQAR
jgi:hypothetical protein